MLDRLKALAGVSVEPRFAPPRPGEIGRISIDSGRAAGAFDWRAATELDVGLERTLAAFRTVGRSRGPATPESDAGALADPGRGA